MRDITNESENIRELQRYLRELHFDAPDENRHIAVDGIFGDETREAVGNFQRRMGMPVTGKADFATWEALRAESEAAKARRAAPIGIQPFPAEDGYTVTEGENSDIAAIVQFILRLLALFYDGIEGAPPTGVWDAASMRDVERFQRDHALPVTGNVDRATWNALAGAYNLLNRTETP